MRPERARDIAEAEHDHALRGSDALDERAVAHDRPVRARIALARLAHLEWPPIEGRDQHERAARTGELLDRPARRRRRRDRNFHRAAAAHREVANQVLAHGAGSSTAGDLLRGRHHECLDLAATDRAPLLAIGGDRHGRAEVARRRPARARHRRDRDTAPGRERAQRGGEDVGDHAGTIASPPHGCALASVERRDAPGERCVTALA
jgi:hypothetical protein